MRASVEWMERHQVSLYLAALVLGGVVGVAAPAVAGRRRRVRRVG